MLATLLAKPDKGMGMHDSIFASTNGQTRKLRSYLPDDHDISGKVSTVCTLQVQMCLHCTALHSSVRTPCCPLISCCVWQWQIIRAPRAVSAWI